ncbi:hypothetical protein [Nocardia phage NS-I]|nr:hypothetical protein [Nocardia phage NS-I]
MTVNLGNKRAGIGVIVLDDDDDWTLKLSPIGAPIWPEGTTAWIRFYDDLDTTLVQMDAVVTEDYLTFSMQHDGSPQARGPPGAVQVQDPGLSPRRPHHRGHALARRRREGVTHALVQHGPPGGLHRGQEPRRVRLGPYR